MTDDTIPLRSLFGQRITGYHSILTAAGGQGWATKRKIMTSFFAKHNQKSLFPAIQSVLARVLETKIKPRAGPYGDVLDIHVIFCIVFSALPGVLGLECAMGVDSPEEIGRRVNVFLDVIPNQLGNLIKVFGAQVGLTSDIDSKRIAWMRILRY